MRWLLTSFFVLGLGVLPAVVSVMTPFSYRDIAPLLRSSIVLAFATGKTLVVLPMLTEGIKEIFKKKGYTDDDAASVLIASYDDTNEKGPPRSTGRAFFLGASGQPRSRAMM